MTEYAGHKNDIILSNGFKVCYGKHRTKGWGWFFPGGGYTKNEAKAAKYANKMQMYILKEYKNEESRHTG